MKNFRNNQNKHIQEFQVIARHHMSGNLAEAEKGYRRLIAQKSTIDNVYQNLAVICKASGRIDEAVQLLKQAVQLNPNATTHYNLGIGLQGSGKTVEAIASYKEAIRLNPNYADAFNNLGYALNSQGEYEEAVACYQLALKAKPDFAIAHNNLGISLQHLGKLEEAVTHYQRALQLKPDFSEAQNNLGIALMKQNQLDAAMDIFNNVIKANPNDAVSHYHLGLAHQLLGHAEHAIPCYKKTLLLKPDYLDAHNNLGLALQHLGQTDEAIACYQHALNVNPNHDQTYNNLGNALQIRGDLDQAIEHYRHALILNPNNVLVHNNLGLAVQEQSTAEKALDHFFRALELEPTYADAYNNLGRAQHQMNRTDDAISSYHRALDLKIDSENLSGNLLPLCQACIDLLKLPVCYETSDAIEDVRVGFETTLDKAKKLFAGMGLLSEQDYHLLLEYLFKIDNFYLSYQQKNDLKLQTEYAELLSGLLNKDIQKLKAPTTIKPNTSRIKLGIASELLREHNGCNWAFNWLAHLPQSDYEIYSYSLEGKTDDLTRKFANLGHYKWLPFKAKTYLSSLEAIKKDQLDVLIIPDVGMTAASKIISVVRLAPIQCVGWGHPITTGSPCIDYYLSSELMEPADAQAHYSEQLIRLPNLGLYFNPPTLRTQITREQFNMPVDRVIIGSVQSLFKYLPQYDDIYPQIARMVPGALFVFIENKETAITDLLRDRLNKAFSRYQLDSAHFVQFIPRLSPQAFMNLFAVLDINLDTLGWNGGNTTFASLAMNCPIVTLPGEFMRGRHSYAMLKRIGVDELIAPSMTDYIHIAAQLGNSETFRAEIKKKIAAGIANLYEDNDVIVALDTFFKEKIKQLQ